MISSKNIMMCIVVVVIAFVTFLSLEIYSFFKMKRIRKKYKLELEEQRKIYEELVEHLSKNKDNFDKRNTDYKYVMHDEAEIRRYLTKINNQNAMEYLIEEKRNYVTERGIDFFVLNIDNASYFDKFDQMDVLRLFSNLINNSIRATDSGGFIRVEFENISKNDALPRSLIVKISNSKDADKKIIEGISDKIDNADLHGYGIKIVKEIVDSFGGSIEWVDMGSEVCVNMNFVYS